MVSLVIPICSMWSVQAVAQMTLRGDLRVSSNGAAIYTVPLVVPPGTAGMAPSLSLNYNSQAGNGFVGMGWSLGGLQSVTRCPQTRAQDGVHGSLNNDGNDRFCLDGQRLVAINGGGYGADGTEYRTEIDSYTRIVSHGVAGSGPAWFEVRTRAGRIAEFGRTSDAFVPAAPGGATARVWSLNKVADTNGNSYSVSYTSAPGKGQVFPSRIDYTSNAAAGLAPYASVRFVYEGRSDIRPLFLAGTLMQTAQRMSRVQTYAGTTLVTDYRLGYQQSTATGRSRLATLTPCGGDGSCLPALTFGWTDGNGRSDMLASVNNGLSRTASITYAALTDGVHVKDSAAVYPVRDWQGAMFVVSRLDTSNGIGGNISSSYRYSGARIDVSGRGLLPFRQTIVTDLQTNIVQTTNYRQDYPFIGLVASENKVLGAQTLSGTVNNYQFKNAQGGSTIGEPPGSGAPYSVSLTSGVETRFDLDGAALQAVNTGYAYDSYANPTQVTSSTWDGYATTTDNSYVNDTTNWRLGQLTAASVTKQAPETTAPLPSNPSSDLSITLSGEGALAQGQTGASFSAAVVNVGAWPSAGTVSVTHTLPTGLSATALSGSGWSCSLGTLTCTRSDPLAGNASYPPISLVADVALSAPSSLTNVVTVAGGGDANSANNSASMQVTVTGAVTIAASTNNLNLWNYLVANGRATPGQAGRWVVTINSGVVIGSSSISAYAFDTGVFPAGSSVQIINNGTIAGAGGQGGSAGSCQLGVTNATAGGTGMLVQSPVTLANNGSIWGGGGGGGGGHITRGPERSGGGGGGGGGYVGGSGGAGANYGAPGELTAGGAGGLGNCNLSFCGRAGGAGGAPGQPGTAVAFVPPHIPSCADGGVAGAAGAAIIGSTYVTWVATGDIRGPLPPAPIVDLMVAGWHSLDFAQGLVGATYNISVSNVGAYPSSGVVSVTDTLPTGLTATGMSGSGWSCSVASLTCTRSDVLAAGASYSPITLTVNVASNAPLSVINTAVVSGGGDANSVNNTSTDPTAITPTVVPPLQVSIASSVNNLNLWNYLVGSGYAISGQPGKWIVTINSGVVIGSVSTGAYAFETGVFPSGSTVQIINNGIITGAGGQGGSAGGCSVTRYNAIAGGPGLLIQNPVSFANNGSIWGGGGGGGGGHQTRGPERRGGGGGGGAGNVSGGGGDGFIYGSAGSLTAGGAGGPGTSQPFVAGGTGGGAGGAPGQPGASVPFIPPHIPGCSDGGLPGAAGAAISGNGYVTWGATGDIRGSIN